MLRHTALSACLFVSLTLAITGTAAAQNDSPTKDIYFTFSESVTVPNMTLPAGRYLFRHVGPNSGRTILQVSSADKGKVNATIMTVQAARSTAPDKPEIRFLETASNFPPAVKTWWYPGQTQGWEFVYPRTQALRLSKAAGEPVLTTAEDVPSDKMASSDLVRVDASGNQSSYSPDAPAAPAPLAGNAQRGEIAAADASANTVANASRTGASGARAEARQTASARTELPKTASLTPLLTLAGAFAVAAGLAVGVWRRRLV